MKTTIRKGTFETNSSSTHSVMVRINPDKGAEQWTEEEAFDQLRAIGATIRDKWSGSYHQIDFGGVKPSLAEFGRTEEAYNTFAMKLLYAVVSFQGDEVLWPGMMAFLKKKLKITGIYIKKLYRDDGTEEGFGYVDHDSTDALARIFSNGISLEEFLFNKDIYIMIDNEG